MHCIFIFTTTLLFSKDTKIYSNPCYKIKYIVNVSPPASRRIPYIRSFRLLWNNCTAHWASALTILTTVRYLKHTTINQCSVKQLISPFGSCESHSRLIHIWLAIVILLRCIGTFVPDFLCKQTQPQLWVNILNCTLSCTENTVRHIFWCILHVLRWCT